MEALAASLQAAFDSILWRTATIRRPARQHQIQPKGSSARPRQEAELQQQAEISNYYS
jgi:hypothetical protein